MTAIEEDVIGTARPSAAVKEEKAEIIERAATTPSADVITSTEILGDAKPEVKAQDDVKAEPGLSEGGATTKVKETNLSS